MTKFRYDRKYRVNGCQKKKKDVVKFMDWQKQQTEPNRAKIHIFRIERHEIAPPKKAIQIQTKFYFNLNGIEIFIPNYPNQI